MMGLNDTLVDPPNIDALLKSRLSGSIVYRTGNSITENVNCEWDQCTYIGSIAGVGNPTPHGEGTLVSRSERHAYVGSFSGGKRDGYGTLITDTYRLFCKWKMNRPCLSDSVRVNYSNGSLYCGGIRLDKKEGDVTSSHCSGFGQWLLSKEVKRIHWGELVTVQGVRYFGEWRENQPHGFGCILFPDGNRYVGSFRNSLFDGLGTLFSPFETALKGNLPVGFDFEKLVYSSGDRGEIAERPAVVYDGVWEKGGFVEEGHVVLPSGVRLISFWSGPSRCEGGELVVSPRACVFPEMSIHTWADYFAWESLFSATTVSTNEKEAPLLLAFQQRMKESKDYDEGQRTITEFLSSDSVVRGALSVFRRCFFFSYGSCGLRSRIGDGGLDSGLGWCSFRRAFGGCLHGYGSRPIGESDTAMALNDIFSFVRSVQRYVSDSLVYGESLLDYDTVIGRWVADHVLCDVSDILLNLYSHTFRLDEDALNEAVSRLQVNSSLDDFGASFARSVAEETLFDPYSDAIRCLEQLSLSHQSLSDRFNVLLRWCKEIDMCARLLQVNHTTATTATVSPGGADDLLPIYLYVISQAKVPNLFSHMKLLADFSNENSFANPTSEEKFCATTFQVCVGALYTFHPFLRDASGVLMSMDQGCTAMESVVNGVPATVHTLYQTPNTSEGVLTENQLCAVVRKCLSGWVAHLFGRLTPSITQSHFFSPLYPLFTDQNAVKCLSNLFLLPTTARAACLTVAAELLQVVGVHLVTLDGNRWIRIPTDIKKCLSTLTSVSVTEETIGVECLSTFTISQCSKLEEILLLLFHV